MPFRRVGQVGWARARSDYIRGVTPVASGPVTKTVAPAGAVESRSAPSIDNSISQTTTSHHVSTTNPTTFQVPTQGQPTFFHVYEPSKEPADHPSAQAFQCTSVQKRHLSIHEYLSMNLLNEYGIPTPASKAAKNPEEAYNIVKKAGLWYTATSVKDVPLTGRRIGIIFSK